MNFGETQKNALCTSPLMYDQHLFDKNLSVSFHVMVGWMIWLRVRSDVAADQAAGEASPGKRLIFYLERKIIRFIQRQSKI